MRDPALETVDDDTLLIVKWPLCIAPHEGWDFFASGIWGVRRRRATGLRERLSAACSASAAITMQLHGE